MTLKKQGSRNKYLIDTSALYPAILEGVIFDHDQFVLSVLTDYEIGNVLWKENKKGKVRNP